MSLFERLGKLPVPPRDDDEGYTFEHNEGRPHKFTVPKERLEWTGPHPIGFDTEKYDVPQPLTEHAKLKVSNPQPSKELEDILDKILEPVLSEYMGTHAMLPGDIAGIKSALQELLKQERQRGRQEALEYALEAVRHTNDPVGYIQRELDRSK